jgi:hypothetical protein
MTPPPLLPSFKAKKSSGNPIAFPFMGMQTKNEDFSFFRFHSSGKKPKQCGEWVKIDSVRGKLRYHLADSRTSH